LGVCPHAFGSTGGIDAARDRSHRLGQRQQEVMSAPTTYRDDDRDIGEELTGRSVV
jgi:hypothetical protein